MLTLHKHGFYSFRTPCPDSLCTLFGKRTGLHPVSLYSWGIQRKGEAGEGGKNKVVLPKTGHVAVLSDKAYSRTLREQKQEHSIRRFPYIPKYLPAGNPVPYK